MQESRILLLHAGTHTHAKTKATNSCLPLRQARLNFDKANVLKSENPCVNATNQANPEPTENLYENPGKEKVCEHSILHPRDPAKVSLAATVASVPLGLRTPRSLLSSLGVESFGVNEFKGLGFGARNSGFMVPSSGVRGHISGFTISGLRL